MPGRRNRSDPSNLRHYCRRCSKFFTVKVVGPTLSGPSAHAQGILHMKRSHPGEGTIRITCTRYCEERAQPEEITARKRLYGPGGKPQVALIKTYEELQDADDHS